MTTPYDDIISLPHHVPTTHPRMSIANRAAQFAPFAALTGYDAAVKETARLTNEQVELGESALAVLDMKLHILQDNLAARQEVAITYFQADTKKSGGEYITVSGVVKKIDNFEGIIFLDSGERILLEYVLDIGCDLFKSL